MALRACKRTLEPKSILKIVTLFVAFVRDVEPFEILGSFARDSVRFVFPRRGFLPIARILARALMPVNEKSITAVGYSGAPLCCRAKSFQLGIRGECNHASRPG